MLLRRSASAWLSSQNAGAKQLSANIEYMKYALGSALAPVIQFVTNLAYQLMRAIQSIAYALTGVNIFANASAKAYASMANSAKKARQETNKLADFDEIHNIQKDNDNSDSGSGSTAPSFDLSKMDSFYGNILEKIKKANWREIGSTIGRKLNETMNRIPWDTIRSTSKKIGTNIAHTLNGFIESTDWNLVGETIAQGINTAIDLAYGFVSTFDWKQSGKSFGSIIDGFFRNIDWKEIAQTLSDIVSGAFELLTGFIQEFDPWAIIDAVISFIKGIDVGKIASSIMELIGSCIGATAKFLSELDEKTKELANNIIDSIRKYFDEKIEGVRRRYRSWNFKRNRRCYNRNSRMDIQQFL